MNRRLRLPIRNVPFIETVFQDLRYGIRSLLNSPGFLIMSVLSLGLGIGANTAVFSVINAVVLRPVRYQQVGRLVTVYETVQARGELRGWVSTANFLDWRKQNSVFEEMELISSGPDPVTLSGHGNAQRIGRQCVTPGLFHTLGVRTVLGRTFLFEDDLEHSIILSHSFWQRHFGSDPALIGKSLSINGTPSEVLGVLTPGFQFFGWGDEVDFWQAINFKNTNWINRSVPWLFAFGRLKSGVTIDQAQVAMEIIAGQLAEAYPDTNKGSSIRLEPLHQTLVEKHKEVLYPLFGAVVFVLLIACTNIANLLLARARTRQKEIAIRSSLGAGPLRLVRQMFTESVVLAFLGGGLGLLLSFWTVKFFVSLASGSPGHSYQIGIDERALAFAVGLSLLTGIAFGLIPALQASRADPNESLKEGGRTSDGVMRNRARSVLVVSEVAVALVLLVSAGLMMNSFIRLQRINPGFYPENLLTLEVSLAGPRYVDIAPKRTIDMNRITPEVERFFSDVLERLKPMPGVQSAAIVDWLPVSAHGPSATFSIAGRPAPPLADRPRAAYISVSPNYFGTMQIPLLKGRDFGERDVDTAPWVAIVNRAMADKFWPNQNPLTQVITLGMVNEERPRQVVGVVENVRPWDLSVETQPQIFISYIQQTEICLGSRKLSRLHKNVVIRTSALSAAFMATVRDAVGDVDKDQAVYGVRTMNQVLAKRLSFFNFYVFTLSVFAIVALVLAAMGIYGVVACAVSERTQEIGIRIALGAQVQQVLRMILKQGLILALIGVLSGLIASLAATRILANFLVAVTPYDPLTLMLASLVLILVSVLAAYIPARRATKVNPVAVLRG